MAPEQVERPEQRPEENEATERELTLDDDVGARLADAVREGAEEMSMYEFTEPSAQTAHGHGPRKGEGSHDLRGAFNVREEFLNENFEGGIVPNGHEAVHAMLAGKEEFIEADEDIFTDVSDTDATRWKKIRKTAKSAPIPPGRRSQLDAQFS